MTAGSLFTLLLVAHLLGDWVVQTDEQAQGKTESWPLMVQHIISYHLLMASLGPCDRPAAGELGLCAECRQLLDHT